MMAAEGGRVNFGEGSPDPDFLNDNLCDRQETMITYLLETKHF